MEILSKSVLESNDISNALQLYTVEDIAKILIISKGNAYQLCEKPLFKKIRVGRVIRILHSSFQAWLNDSAEDEQLHIESYSIEGTLFTVEQIAAILKISKSKAYELCKEENFKILQLGRNIRVNKTSFYLWLINQLKY